MKMRYLAAALLAFLAMPLPAKAVTVNVFDVGAEGTTNLQGYTDQGTIPGLTGSLYLQYDGVTNGGLTWNFDYTVTNTSRASTPPARGSPRSGSLRPRTSAARLRPGCSIWRIVNPTFPNVPGNGTSRRCHRGVLLCWHQQL